jgi:hypothetical protein
MRITLHSTVSYLLEFYQGSNKRGVSTVGYVETMLVKLVIYTDTISKV